MTPETGMTFGPPIFRGMSDALQAAIETGNAETVAFIIAAANTAMEDSVISYSEYAELVADAQDAGHDV